MGSNLLRLLSRLTLITAALLHADHALAMTVEQAKARCIEQVKPSVRACVHAKIVANSGSKPDEFIAGCKAEFVAPVKICIAKLTGLTGARQAAAGRSCESLCSGYCTRSAYTGSIMNLCHARCTEKCYMRRAGMQ